MSILNVLLTAEQLVVTVDTWAEDALSGQASEGAKVLLIPQHQILLATRGSAQFFLRIYQLCLEASFRAGFTIEQLTAELGHVIDQLWPNYAKAVAEAGLPAEYCSTELVLGGWSPQNGRMVATAYANTTWPRLRWSSRSRGSSRRPVSPCRPGRPRWPPRPCLRRAGCRHVGSTKVRAGGCRRKVVTGVPAAGPGGRERPRGAFVGKSNQCPGTATTVAGVSFYLAP